MSESDRYEEVLERAREQQLRIAKQQELIRILECAGQRHLLPEAYRILSQMTRTHGTLSDELRKAALQR